MSVSLNDTLTSLRADPNSKSVQITLMIHSQAKNDPANHFYGHRIFYGYGYLRHFTEAIIARPHLTSEYIATYGAFKVLNNVNYSVDGTASGEWGEQQTFIVKSPIPENWHVRIDPPSRIMRPGGQSPRLTMTASERPERPPWSIDLTEDNAFLRGIGPDPLIPNEKALYSVAFVEVLNQITWPYIG